MTVGTLTYRAAEKVWVITTTPDVTMRIKRIFPRVQQPVATILRLTDTDEIANELEWVRARYPFDMVVDDTQRLTVKAQAYRDHQARLDKLLSAPADMPEFKLALPVRSYQQVAAALMLAQQYLMLADEVGLGKTASAIATMTDKKTLPALVVVQAHLPKQWVKEVRKFLPDLVCHIVKQRAEYPLPPAHVYIISYSKLDAWWGFLAMKVRTVIYDEIQELRRPESKKYEAAKHLREKVSYVMGLSATPIYNYGDEVWNVLSLLKVDPIGSRDEFLQEWCEYIGNDKWRVKDPDALGHYLRNQKIMLRRTRKDVGRELPPVIRYVQDAEFDEAIYNQGVSAADALARTILNGSFIERGQAAREFDLKLRQATGLAKAPYVAELVKMLVDSGERVLLGGWHLAVYDIWRDRLRELKPVFFTGQESESQKNAAKEAFLKGESKVLVMSLRSGAGTDGLQHACSCVVLGEMDWSPSVHEQFIGRVARDGQQSSVQVFIPVAPVGSDPTMASVLGLKESQSTGILDLGTKAAPDFVETDPQRIRQLAINYLKSRNLPLNLQPVTQP